MLYSDLLGRTHMVWRTVGSGPPELMQTMEYDSAGRLHWQTDRDGVGALTEYNSRNEVSREAVDMDGDGAFGVGDRITVHDRAVVSATPPDGSAARACTRQAVTCAADSSSTVSYSSADGLHSWTVANGRTTHTRTVLGTGPGERTVRTTYPDGTYQVRQYGSGLLAASVRYDANDDETASVTYQYDGLRRGVQAEDGRTGETVAVDLDAAGQVVREKRSDTATTRTYQYDAMGRVEKVKRRGGGMVEYEYDATGQVHRISGSGMMPRRFSYDPRGLCTSMKTFQGGLDGAGAVLTSWNYDHHSGRLKSKQINGITVEDYDYTPAGRLHRVTRYLPAGTVQTTYTRDASGAVVAITHSDASPGVTTVRDAKGRPAQVTDAVGTHTYTYNADDQVLSESLPQLSGGLLSHTYDASGRRTATALSLNGTALVTWTAAYDSAGRLATVSGPSHPTGSAGGLSEVPPMPSRVEPTSQDRGGMRRATYGEGPVLRTARRQRASPAPPDDAAPTPAAGRYGVSVHPEAGQDLLRRSSPRTEPGGVCGPLRGPHPSHGLSPWSMTDGHCAAGYGYLAGSDLVEAITCTTDATDPRLVVTRAYDTENRLASILAEKPGTTPLTLARWDYSLDDDGRRTRTDVKLIDPTDATVLHAFHWDYAYDGLDQLAGATCRWDSTNAIIPGRELVYDHDSISNRRTAGRLDPATAAGEEQYTANDLNQYTARALPGAVHISGFADPAATVTVNNEPTTRDGAAFHLRLPVDNSAGPATLAVTIRAVRYDATEGQDVVVTASGNVTVPAASEALAVADRGGLGADSLQSYEWDINDRLTAVESTTAVPAADRRRVEFAYDYQGRRVSKEVYTWNAGTTSWDLATETRFVYDGWNLLAEFAVPPSGSPTLQRTCLWGLDLEGLRTGTPGQEAGGIGGLIAVTEWSGTPLAPSSALYAVADGNGNIAVLVDAESAAGAVETTEHEPFGRVVARHRADAGALPAGAGSLCPFGFSTKYLDPETGLQYFGYRYFSPDLGRWLCRDPLGEKGGVNLYAYCRNDPVNGVDPVGLAALIVSGGINAHPDKDEHDQNWANFVSAAEIELRRLLVTSDEDLEWAVERRSYGNRAVTEGRPALYYIQQIEAKGAALGPRVTIRLIELADSVESRRGGYVGRDLLGAVTFTCDGRRRSAGAEGDKLSRVVFYGHGYAGGDFTLQYGAGGESLFGNQLCFIDRGAFADDATCITWACNQAAREGSRESFIEAWARETGLTISGVSGRVDYGPTAGGSWRQTLPAVAVSMVLSGRILAATGMGVFGVYESAKAPRSPVLAKDDRTLLARLLWRRAHWEVAVGERGNPYEMPSAR